ncbi:hypothetical protein U472_11670 [Orenia metallireducens]|uniref:Uncharacterized protein n=1 Tax=Orenia metallireducens TaxID=1413210 RepID=A0A1C0A8T5_9FIRM|nr:hypothetical protein [Orenia metallireducens]OCL26631.1 hypothetical protein U472_11670 [Orenia metallireducens]
MSKFFKGHKLVIVVFVLQFLLGCSANKIVEGDNNDDNQVENRIDQQTEVDLRAYLPIREGMLYKYQGEGNEYATFTTETKFVKDNLIQVHKNNGGTEIASVYRVEKEEMVLLQENPEFYSDTNLLNEVDDKADAKEVILKSPLKVGEKWDNAKKRREIVAIDEQLTTPAGNFYDVVKVKVASIEEDRDFESYEYYAKNIGLIMLESRGEDYQVTSKLKSYGSLE